MKIMDETGIVDNACVIDITKANLNIRSKGHWKSSPSLFVRPAVKAFICWRLR